MKSGGGGRLYGQPQRTRGAAAVADTEVAARTQQVEAIAKGTSLIPPALSSERLGQALSQLHQHYAQARHRQQQNTAVERTTAIDTNERLSSSQPFNLSLAASSATQAGPSMKSVTDFAAAPSVASTLAPSSPPRTAAPMSFHVPLLFGSASDGVPQPYLSIDPAARSDHSGSSPVDARLMESAMGGHGEPPRASDPSFSSTSKDVLARCGLPTAERVRSVFAAAESHSELGAMLQWLATSVVSLFTKGLASPAVLGFAENWERQLAYAASLAHDQHRPAGLPPPVRPSEGPTVTAALSAHAFELQGVPTLFTFIWAQLAALEAAATQASSSQLSPWLAKAAARAASRDHAPPSVDGASQSNADDHTAKADPPQDPACANTATKRETGPTSPVTTRRQTVPFTAPVPTHDTEVGTVPSPIQRDVHSNNSTRRAVGVAAFAFSAPAESSRGPSGASGRASQKSGLLPVRTVTPTTEEAPVGGPVKQFASTAHNLSRAQTTMHSPAPRGGQRLSSTLPANAASRRAPAVRSAAPGTHAGTAPTHTRTFHEMEQQARRVKLQRELGVKEVRDYGAERDVGDYMRNVDAWRAELMDDAPVSKALLVSSTGGPRTLANPAATDPTSTPPPANLTTASVAQPVTSSPPSVGLPATPASLEDGAFQTGKARFSVHTNALTCPERPPGAPRQGRHRSSAGSRSRSPTDGRPPETRTLAVTGTVRTTTTTSTNTTASTGTVRTSSRVAASGGGATKARQPSQEGPRPREWLDPLEIANASATGTLPPLDPDEDAPTG